MLRFVAVQDMFDHIDPIHFSIRLLVPPGSGEFGIRLWGEGAEGLKATIFDPAGNQVWQKDDISAVLIEREAAPP